MATTELDKLAIAWARLQRAINETLPQAALRARRVQGKVGGSLPPGPRPS